MITDSLWVEMHKVKGYLRQIEKYTDRKRHQNRMISIIIVCSSVLCAVFSIFSQYPCGRWIGFILALFVAITTCIKELIPQWVQPERELCELDEIHHFYSGMLIELEHLYVQRFDSKSKIDDSKLIERLYKLQKTEGDRVDRINELCRRFTEKERKQIVEETELYYRRKFNQNNYESET